MSKLLEKIEYKLYANEAELQMSEKCDTTPESVELNIYEYNVNSSS